MLPIFISVKEFCRLLSIGKTKAFEIIRRGRVDSILEGRRRLIFLESVFRYVAQLGNRRAEYDEVLKRYIDHQTSTGAAEAETTEPYVLPAPSISENSNEQD
jgi:hypothetical protein